MTYFITIIFAVLGFIVANVATNSITTDENDCPEICPALYAPICATNGKIFKEFSNKCELKSSNCRLERSAIIPYTQIDKDWCTSEFTNNLMEKVNALDLKPECLKPCPMIYAPLCVSNGKYRGVLSNSCQMDLVNCILGNNASQKFKVLQPDSC